jgi:hypothetical protein
MAAQCRKTARSAIASSELSRAAISTTSSPQVSPICSLALTSGPAKKSKKKNKDLIPAQLQAQWEKDRLAKKAKKEQRQLERLFAELNPHPATHKGKKAKGKGKSKAAQASLAHLIPASASEIADMFDVSSGEEADSAPQGRMGRMRNLLLPETLEQVALDLRQFVADEERTTYSLPPMDKETRKKVHMLAEAFGLVSKSRGSGHQRFM